MVAVLREEDRQHVVDDDAEAAHAGARRDDVDAAGVEKKRVRLRGKFAVGHAEFLREPNRAANRRKPENDARPPADFRDLEILGQMFLQKLLRQSAQSPRACCIYYIRLGRSP